MGAGINILHTEGNVSIQAGGDIVAGNKTVINNIIQRLARELTTTPYKFLASYDVADRDIFYGRAVVVDELDLLAARGCRAFAGELRTSRTPCWSELDSNRWATS